jgi:hypothetical protein
LLWGAGWTDMGLVFTHEYGRALTPDGVSQRFDRLLLRHELPPIRLHDLRHVAATLALTAGVDIKVVSEQLGHTTTQITGDIYMSVVPQVAQAAAALVPRAAPQAGGHNSVPTVCPSTDKSDTEDDLHTGKTPGQKGWGGWDSNPGPRDFMSQISGGLTSAGGCFRATFPQVRAFSIVGPCHGEPETP